MLSVTIDLARIYQDDSFSVSFGPSQGHEKSNSDLSIGITIGLTNHCHIRICWSMSVNHHYLNQQLVERCEDSVFHDQDQISVWPWSSATSRGLSLGLTSGTITPPVQGVATYPFRAVLPKLSSSTVSSSAQPHSEAHSVIHSDPTRERQHSDRSVRQGYWELTHSSKENHYLLFVGIAGVVCDQNQSSLRCSYLLSTPSQDGSPLSEAHHYYIPLLKLSCPQEMKQTKTKLSVSLQLVVPYHKSSIRANPLSG